MVGLRDIFGAAGAVGGIMVGWLTGGLLGALLGCLVGGVLVGAPFVLFEEWQRRRKWAVLQPVFGTYHAREREDEWTQTEARLRPGEVVKGTVVHATPSVAYVDIGYGFPAALYAVAMPVKRNKNPSKALASSHAPLPQLGSEIEAQIMGFLPLEREIEITPGGHWLLLDGEIVGFLAYPEWPLEGRYYLRFTRSDAYDAFMKVPRSELSQRCEVLTGDECERVSVKRESWSGYVYVTISLLQDA